MERKTSGPYRDDIQHQTHRMVSYVVNLCDDIELLVAENK